MRNVSKKEHNNKTKVLNMNTFFEVQKEYSVHKREYADTQMVLFILQSPIKNRALMEYPAGRSAPECQNALLYLWRNWAIHQTYKITMEVTQEHGIT